MKPSCKISIGDISLWRDTFFRCCIMIILHAYQHLLSEFVDYLRPCRCISYLVCTIFVYYFQGLLQLKGFQQTPTRSKPSPGYRLSTTPWCHGGTNTDMSIATTWRSDVYHLLPMSTCTYKSESDYRHQRVRCVIFIILSYVI